MSRSGTLPTISVLVFSCLPAFAQTAQITGRVTDSSGAVVPSARLTITNTQTGIERDAATNDQGYYTMPLLTRGLYTVVVQMRGFRSVRQTGIALDEGQVMRLDFALEVGHLSEVIEVSGRAPLIDSSTAQISTVIPNQRIVDLPMLNRNVLTLALLVPGMRAMGDFGGLPISSFEGSRIAIAGGPATANNFMVDGTAAENFTSGGLNIIPSVDATAEFRIVARSPSAEFGRSGGGVINIISKSGTNEYHGSAYEFHRNKVLNANGFFPNKVGAQRSPYVFNEYGATIGGPIRRDKTFFFFNWEEFKIRTQSRSFLSVPTAEEKAGDFRNLKNSSGQTIVIYDPLTTRLDPTNPSRRSRDPFPGNLIPADRIHPAAKAIAAYWPQPNLPGLQYTHAQNFFGQASAPQDKRIFGIKLDHNFTAFRRLSGKVTYDKTSKEDPNFFNNLAGTAYSPIVYQRRSVVLNYTESLRPDLLLELKAGLNRYAPKRFTRSYGFDVSSIGLPKALGSQMQVPQFPRFTISDAQAIGAAGDDHLVQASNAWTFGGALTKISGKHNIKLGAEERVYQLNNTQGGNVANFNFARTFTQGPNPNTPSSTAGYGVATFLLGTPTTGSAARWFAHTYTVKNFAAFIQDDWRIFPDLTLNLGMRWEFEGGMTDRYDGLTNFDPTARYYVGNVPVTGGLRFVGKNGLPRGMRDSSLRDFEPRLGLAYQATAKTVVRGGWGISHLPTSGYFVQARRTGFTNVTSMVTSIDGGFMPYNTLTNPFPDGIQPPQGHSLGLLTGIGTDVSGTLRSLKRGYSIQWNLNVQRELPGNWVVELGYMGNRGVSMPAGRYFRYLKAEYLKLGTALQEQVANPFYGAITTGSLAQRTVQRAALLQTYPQFTLISSHDSWADSIYHAFTARVERRFSHGLSALVAFTHCKQIDNHNGSQFAAGGSDGVRDWDNLRAERAVSSDWQPRSLVISATYAIPIGKSGHPLYKGLVGGWQLSPILSISSGGILAIAAPAAAFGTGRPDVVGDPQLNDPTPERWFNTAAFVPSKAFSIGNAPRNLPRTRSDYVFNIDTSLAKNFAIREHVNLQIRLEAFNTLNYVRWGHPGTTVNSPTYGVVTSQGNSPRNMMVAAKLTF